MKKNHEYFNNHYSTWKLVDFLNKLHSTNDGKDALMDRHKKSLLDIFHNSNDQSINLTAEKLLKEFDRVRITSLMFSLYNWWCAKKADCFLFIKAVRSTTKQVSDFDWLLAGLRLG
jgi:hypothetical protein